MDKEEAKKFLFDISNAVKHFYETPIIFFTENDYADGIFNAMCSLRTALQNDSKKEVIDIIVDVHLQWTHIVNNIENYQKRLEHNIPREEVYQAICYTIDAMASRLKYYQKYMEKHKTSLTNDEVVHLNADLEIVEDMHKEVTDELLKRLKCFRAFSEYEEFKLKINDGVEELLHWVDKIHDKLAMQLCKYMNLNVPHLSSNLTKTLQQIVDDIKTSKTPQAKKILKTLKERGREIDTMIRSTASHNLEISKLLDKIGILESRIARLESETDSAAVTALKHKKKYLENRLSSLENLKISLKNLYGQSGNKLEEDESEKCACKDFYNFKIFNHFLPVGEREKLVTELCYLWDLAVFGARSRKSIISILSAAENKEEFTDELGTFYIDEYSRKIYKLSNDDTLYQPNEMNELVPLTDDPDHIYYFDACGRYFVDNKTRQRVYKAHATASEYMMGSTGVLLKFKEVRDGITYHYDNYGRYYINEEGKNIYRDSDSISEYENDGLGNLVRIRSHVDFFEPCPDDDNVTEDFKYLKNAVGPALKACIAECILHQPADPIKYLSTSLLHFREKMENKEKRARDNEALFAERENIAAAERAKAEAAAREAALLAQGGSECSYDSNLLKYTTEHPVDALSTSSI